MTKIDNDTRQVYIKTLIIVGAVLLVALAWLWWNIVYNSPKNVFDTMLNNSLSTVGVTKTVSQEDPTGKLEQKSQAHFGASNYVDVRTTVSQQNDSGNSKVETQTLGDGMNTYVRYTDISIPSTNDKPSPDFSSLLNIWGKEKNNSGTQNVFTEAVFGAVLFGSLPNDKRAELLGKIYHDNLYDIDFSKVERIKQDGRSKYVYTAKLKTETYIAILKTYDSIIGLDLTKELDESLYKDAPPINVKLTIDVASKTLSKLEYVDQNRTETLTGYGIHKNLELPENPIAREELDTKLQEVLMASQ